MSIRIFVFVLLIAVGFWQYWAAEIVTLGHGVKVDAAPVQQSINNVDSFDFNDYLITPLADFALKAKVLSRENYWLDRGSDLSSTDLALGWQNMSDEKVLQHIDISQSGRWYRWRVEQFPIPRREIETQSANMHIVPADDRVAVKLDSVKPGQIIQIKGQLIKANAPDGWNWKSSLTREDTGARACELVFVTDLVILQP